MTGCIADSIGIFPALSYDMSRIPTEQRLEVGRQIAARERPSRLNGQDAKRATCT